jgi:phage terminase large subunit-like protein
VSCSVVVAGNDRTLARENLIRRDLTPAQRAKLVARRKAAYEAVYPETKQGGDQTAKLVAKTASQKTLTPKRQATSDRQTR